MCPIWTSDGEQTIYRSDKTPAGLWYMNADGSDQTPLAERRVAGQLRINRRRRPTADQGALVIRSTQGDRRTAIRTCLIRRP